ncbi:MAG: TRM11 family SAM-dependent methyltransferase [Acidimicrobiales bacterium]
MPTDLPLSIWPVAQRTARTQRAGRYLELSSTHPAKMLPAIAARAIATYTQPGDLVLDPMCGIGTTLVEAVHLGRDAIGVEYEAPWADLARANVALAQRQGASGQAEVVTGDARHLEAVVDPAVRGLAALVVTSPPYGASLHGQVRVRAGQGLEKSHDRYSRDPGNLAHQSLEHLLGGFTTILAGCARLLRPGGFVVVTARPWRRGGELIDLPSAVLACGRAAGLFPYERNVALLAGLRGDALVPRVSFFQLEHVRKARSAGVPLLGIAHEDLLVLRRPA